jgi:hypothetical protein
VHAGFHPSTPLSRSANELPGPLETINDPADHSLGGFFSATLLILVLLLARAAVCRLLGPGRANSTNGWPNSAWRSPSWVASSPVIVRFMIITSDLFSG